LTTGAFLGKSSHIFQVRSRKTFEALKPIIYRDKGDEGDKN
jgi:hypothetical protein